VVSGLSNHLKFYGLAGDREIMSDRPTTYESMIEDIVGRVIRRELERVGHGNDATTLYTSKEVAGILKVPVTFVETQARQGKIKATRLGRYVRFTMADVDAYIEENRKSLLKAQRRRAWRVKEFG